MDVRNIISGIKIVYDKVILVVALLVLLCSIILLIFLTDHEKRALRQAAQDPVGLQQKKVKPLDLGFLETAIESAVEPRQLDAWTNRLMVAELRVACVKCGRPIPVEADKCPFRNCGAAQPARVDVRTRDSDLDGLPDAWEKQFGLNPQIDDAQKDSDQDGFTNLEEYRGQTNPNDPAAHPPLAAKLRLLKAARVTLSLSFQGVQRITAQEKRYSVRDRRTGQDHYLKIGDKVDGYIVAAFEEKFRDVRKPGLPKPVKEDISILTLKKDQKEIQLVIGQRAGQGDWQATLVFTVDNSRHLIKIGDELSLKNERYKVVDIKTDAVILADISTGQETTVGMGTEEERRSSLKKESQSDNPSKSAK